ncbi:DUF2567 domain-containing protein [Streptomyces sp. 8L]|uniref:DUF2567 domain-containing protein n=1 Tax=Streptomyces sp. 8L TaxID=2877242 RepID=UPI001CD1F403|nr:DUF2567 domain-containing protein [Streptomyces sp. 8L]MCA1220523.1 DUF2567 domain-containing protein [Streptomyces sp. 8L]
MNAPLTPPHPSSPDPWQQPEGAVPGDGSWPEQPGTPEGPGTRAELAQAGLVLVAAAVAGLLLGALWVWLAPRVPLTSDSTAVLLKDVEGEEAIGADGTFVLLALAFGVVSAVAVFLWRRRGGVPLVFGLALGGLAASFVAWKFGAALGPTTDVVAHAKQVGVGHTFDAPLELGMKGALLAWPVAATLVHLGLTAAFGPRDPEPYAEPGAFPESGRFSDSDGESGTSR